MKKLIQALFFLPLCVQLTSCSNDDDNSSDSVETVLPDTVTFDSPSLYPEDFAYDSENERFFAGSIFTGNIVSVDLEGNVTPFASSDDLITTTGILFDEANNHVVVCNTNPGLSDQGGEGVGQLATVIRYDASNGEEVASYDLTDLLADSAVVINDIVLDDEGNLYTTNSFGPVVYKIAVDGTTSVFATNDFFATAAGTFGLNGIEFHPDGYLIVSHYQNNKLFKISIEDPTDVEEIEVGTALGNIDGIRLMDNNTLLAISNSITGGEHTAFAIDSMDDWSTGTVANSVSLGSGLFFPTTVEFINDTPYVVSSYIAELRTEVTSTSTFEINKVEFGN